ncbi:MAG: hypothetical protein JXR84_22705 [Anaerolineae bacterium]|nr:hypothetical protein [Anaerolineae bacterium]
MSCETYDTKDTPRSPESPEPQALSDAGRNAMQGRQSDHALAYRTDYIHAAEAGVAEHPDHYTKAQGRAGERVALQEIKNHEGCAVDLNDGGAANFPIYDVAGPNEVASVKVRGLNDGDTLSDATLGQYTRDFEEAIGRGSGAIEPALGTTDTEFTPSKFNNAARHLHEMAKTSDGMPSELAQSEDAAADYLRENATLKIPSDHAEQVNTYLRGRLLEDDPVAREVQASRLGLDLNSPTYEKDVEGMLARIQGLPIQSQEIKDVLNH